MVFALMVLIPVAGATIIAFMNESRRRAIRAVSLASTFTASAASIYAVYRFVNGDPVSASFKWLPYLNSYISFGLSGLSAGLLLLTGLLSFLAVAGSFPLSIKNEKLYHAMLLILFSSLYGVFSARDFLLFYLFWEAVLIPMYFLIGIFGSENRRYAATKFFIYTFAASILMLVGFFIVAQHSETLLFRDLVSSAGKLPAELKLLSFLLIFTGFAVKLPVFPFHTWLPDAHVEAPTQASVLLAGILLKMGGYGFFELLGPMFPDLISRYSLPLLLISAVSVIYGSLAAYSQNDIKKLVAYSSVAHMGFVTACLSAFSVPESRSAAGFVMWAHGFITGMLFFLIGLIYERYHSRSMDAVKNLADRYPFLGWSLFFGSMASLGLPGLAGFVGEFMTSAVVFEKHGFLSAAVIAGVFLNATYSLKLIKNVVFTPGERESDFEPGSENLRFSEKLVISAFVVAVVLSGILPELITNILEKA